jgi:glycosyltransferase involved in cell wall biosynthesis
VLSRTLPGINVHPILPYKRYLEVLSACDVNLSPYPFGGLHSVVDSLRQGLAVVAMDCPEPHGRTDAMLLRRLGMPEWLIARDEDAYVAAAVRVIDDDATRVALGLQALALDIDQLMFGDGTTSLRSEVVDAMWWVYENHEAIQTSGRHVWRDADRAPLLAGA